MKFQLIYFLQKFLQLTKPQLLCAYLPTLTSHIGVTWTTIKCFIWLRRRKIKTIQDRTRTSEDVDTLWHVNIVTFSYCIAIGLWAVARDYSEAHRSVKSSHRSSWVIVVSWVFQTFELEASNLLNSLSVRPRKDGYWEYRKEINSAPRYLFRVTLFPYSENRKNIEISRRIK